MAIQRKTGKRCLARKTRKTTASKKTTAALGQERNPHPRSVALQSWFTEVVAALLAEDSEREINAREVLASAGLLVEPNFSLRVKLAREGRLIAEHRDETSRIGLGGRTLEQLPAKERLAQRVKLLLSKLKAAAAGGLDADEVLATVVAKAN